MITIDKETCIGCGTCTVVAENTFALGDDGKAYIKDERGDDEEKIKQAVEACPVEAIEVED